MPHQAADCHSYCAHDGKRRELRRRQQCTVLDLTERSSATARVARRHSDGEVAAQSPPRTRAVDGLHGRAVAVEHDRRQRQHRHGVRKPIKNRASEMELSSRLLADPVSPRQYPNQETPPRLRAVQLPGNTGHGFPHLTLKSTKMQVGHAAAAAGVQSGMAAGLLDTGDGPSCSMVKLAPTVCGSCDCRTWLSCAQKSNSVAAYACTTHIQTRSPTA